MTRENRNYLHRLIYVYSLSLAAVALPLSEFLLSISQFILATNWLLEGNFKKKWDSAKTNKPLIVFLLLFFIHIIWLLNTNNFNYAFHDIRIKLPLFVLPFIIATTDALSKNELLKVLRYFNNAVLVSTFIMLALYFNCCGFEYTEVKSISIFISHIRFSLMLVFSIFIYLYFLAVGNGYFTNKYKKVLYVLITIWQVFFLFLLHARTGMVVFLLVLPIFLIWAANRTQRVSLKIASYMFAFFVIALPILFTIYVINSFYNTDKIDFNNLPKYTAHHNKYYNNPNLKILENGHYVWTNICYKELKEEWNKVSSIPFDSVDAKKQQIKYTIIRYLTSKGLTKDADGIKHLTPQDIKLIEQGETNYLAANKLSLYYLVYKIIWEIDVYKKTGDANHHSVTQRYEFLKTAFAIIKDNFWFGTGTGDVDDAFKKKYDELNTSLDKKHRLRAHNQLVTFFVTFGIIGFFISLIAIFYPYFITKTHQLFLANIFLFIIIFSFLNEDTLETQMGVTFFSFFYTIFVFGYKNKEL